MSAATMTLIGLYNWDNTIFDKLNVPEALNKDTLVNNILLRSGEFEVMFADPDFLKDAIGMFSDTWQPTFERWVNALAIEYNPLENYDRKEDWSDTRNSHGSGTTSGSTSGSSSSSTSGTTSSTTTNKVSAYDAGDALTTRDQAQTYGADGSSSSGTSSETSSGTTSNSSSEGAKHDGRIHGNIGVTTSQQMLIAELDLGYWNVYEKITDLFLTNFVIPVY